MRTFLNKKNKPKLAIMDLTEILQCIPDTQKHLGSICYHSFYLARVRTREQLYGRKYLFEKQLKYRPHATQSFVRNIPRSPAPYMFETNKNGFCNRMNYSNIVLKKKFSHSLLYGFRKLQSYPTLVMWATKHICHR